MAALPAIPPWLSTAMTVVSTVATLASSFSSSQADQTDYSAQVAASNYNAKVNEENAAIVADQTKAQETQKRRESYLRAGTAVASGSANGGLTGSVLDILSDNTAQEEMDILNLRYEGLLKQRAYKSDAALDRMTAGTTKTAAKQSSAAGILSGVAKVGSLMK